MLQHQQPLHESERMSSMFPPPPLSSLLSHGIKVESVGLLELGVPVLPPLPNVEEEDDEGGEQAGPHHRQPRYHNALGGKPTRGTST